MAVLRQGLQCLHYLRRCVLHQELSWNASFEDARSRLDVFSAPLVQGQAEAQPLSRSTGSEFWKGSSTLSSPVPWGYVLTVLVDISQVRI